MGRRRKKKHLQGEVELNLAAMLDMAFQLLAFFILTFKPAPTEGYIALRMPPPQATTKPGAAAASEPNPAMTPIDRLETLMVTIKSNAEGGIGSLQIEEGAPSSNLNEFEQQLNTLLGARRQLRTGHFAGRLRAALRQPGAHLGYLFARQTGVGRAIDQTQHHRTARGHVAGARFATGTYNPPGRREYVRRFRRFRRKERVPISSEAKRKVRVPSPRSFSSAKSV